MRDQQRQRIYDAESHLPRGKEYPTLRECQRRVDAIVGSAWWKKNALIPRSAVRVHDGRGHRRAMSYGGVIALPKWARCEKIILHELAHEACPSSEKHGPRYARMMYGMLRRFHSVDAAEEFLVLCAARNIKVAGKKLPRSKVTDAHRQAVANERAARTEQRRLGGLQEAIETATIAARNTGQRIVCELHPGIGYMYGQAGDTDDATIFAERRRARAIVYPTATGHRVVYRDTLS